MKRREFLLASGSALLGSTALASTNQKPVLGLNFDLVGTESVQPSNADSILVDFQNFELVPKYVDEGDATVTITLDVDGFDSVENQATVSFQNGQTNDKSDLGSAIPIVLDGVDTSETALDGSIMIDIEHSSISESYSQSFTITDDPLQEGLVGWWPLHEWSGRANDLSGNDNHGSVNGATQGVLGRSGLTAYAFDGGNDYVDITGIPNLSSMTFCMWIRVPESNPSSSKGIAGLGKNNRQDIYLNTNGDVKMDIHDGTSSNNVFLPLSNDYAWYHIAHRWDGSTIYGYLNGELKDTTSADSMDSYGDKDRIGERGFSFSTDHWNGAIADVRVYDRDLSEDEIQTLYEYGSGDYTQSSLHDGTDSGAVSRYEFNDDTIDSWNSEDGSDKTDAGYLIDSIRGKSKRFNGSGYIRRSSVSGSTDQITVSTWVKFDDITANTESMVNERDSNNIGGFVLQKGSNGQVDWHVYNDGSYIDVKDQYDLQSNKWYHFVGTYDGSVSKLYRNGVLVNQESDAGGINGVSKPVDIGAYQTGSTEYLNGYLDDTRIYERALNSREVQQLYQWGARGKDLRERTTTLNKADMAGWWKLNETSGSTAYDSSGNGNDGLIVNGGDSTVVGGDTGPTGQDAYVFDGTNDYIDTPLTAELPINGSLTFSLWFKTTSTKSMYPIGARNSSTLERVRMTMWWDSGDIGIDHYDNANGTGRIFGDSTDLNDGDWHHLVGSFENNGGTAFGSVYVDGELIAQDRGSMEGISTSTNYWIGDNNNSGTSTGRFKGTLSDIRIYERALTPQEVSYLYEQKL